MAPLTTPRAELRRYRGDHGAHAHGHAQVLYGLSGSLDVEIDGLRMCVDASAGLIVPAGAWHASKACNGAAVWVIDAPPDRQLDRVRAFAVPGRRLDCWSVADALRCAQSAPRVLPRRRLDVAALTQTVSAALHEGWPSARLAACCSLSVPQFHVRWQALTGNTPQAWLRDLRLDRAEHLLRRGWSGEAVAAQTGYASASSMLYALRRERRLGARTLRQR